MQTKYYAAWLMLFGVIAQPDITIFVVIFTYKCANIIACDKITNIQIII